MGVNHSYMLYFKKEDLWHAMDGLLTMAEPHHPPAIIHFPDHQVEIPLDPWPMHREIFRHDDPEFNFATALRFDWDEELAEWVSRHGSADDPDRAPPDPEEEDQASIGYIYLNIYTDLSRRFTLEKPVDDLVLFEFDTTGTRMSLLFSNSTSMREAFVHLLEHYHGVCGMFNWESDGFEMFWLGGRHLSEYVYDLDQLLGEIEGRLNRGG